jgi:hypothetical protein
MLRHLRLAASMAVGELSVPSANKRAFQVFPLKQLILYVLPFPKGALTWREWGVATYKHTDHHLKQFGA